MTPALVYLSLRELDMGYPDFAITKDVIWINLHIPLGLSFFSYKQKDDL